MNIGNMLGIACAAALGFTAGSVQAAATWSLATDFNIAANTDATLWSYRTYSGGAYTLLANNAQNANTLWGTAFATPPLLWNGGGYWGIGRNDSVVTQNTGKVNGWAPGAVYLHPDTATAGGLVISWLAPHAMTIDVNYTFAKVMDINPWDGIRYSIIKRAAAGGDTTLKGLTYVGDYGTSLTDSLVLLSVAAGDRLYFFFDNNGDAGGDICSAAIEITGYSLSVPVSWDFNSIAGGSFDAAGQFETANNLRVGPTVPGWTGSGPSHAVERGAGTSDWAPMFYLNYVLEQPVGILANESGKVYRVAFDVGPAVYKGGDGATASNDWLRIKMVSSNNVTVGTYSSKPGAWAGAETLHADSFLYTGDGSGPVKLSFSGNNPGLGRFQGAIDNVSVSSVSNTIPFKLGFTVDGTGTDGWTGYNGINNVDGSPDGYSWDIKTLVTVATGSSLLGSDSIMAGDYTISFLNALTPLWATAATKSLTVTAKDTRGNTLGSKTVEMGQGYWNRETLTFTVPPYSSSSGAYLVLEFSADITSHLTGVPWHGYDSITAFVSPIPVPKGTLIRFY